MPKALVLGGATGLLGQALTTVLAQRGWETESMGRETGQLTSLAFISDQLEKSRPDVVFNAIAWTQVDDAEDHEEEAMLVNCTLPDTLARAVASLEGCRLVHYSTDFVFSGQGQRAWTEEDTPNPINVYGKSKLQGEKAVRDILPDRSCILRTAWLFGPGRKNFVQTILGACKNGALLKVVDDQTGSPTFTHDLALWSALLAEKGATGLWHAVNSGQANWYELAAEAIQAAEANCGIAPIPSSQWPQKAKRPAYSVLSNNKLAAFLGKKPRPWQQALRDHIICGTESLPRNLC